MRSFPESRVRRANGASVAAGGDYVVYWMTATRRPQWSFPLQRAADWATELGKPLVIFEALRCDYPWASDRLHRFVVDGMIANAGAFARGPAFYYPYVEREIGGGRGLLVALAERACVVVGDDFPAFFLPRMVAAAAPRLACRFELVDGNGLLPMTCADEVFATAHAFRRHLHRTLPAQLAATPTKNPLRRRLPALPSLPEAIARQWPPDAAILAGRRPELAALPIDHSVPPVPETAGGWQAARARLRAFVADELPRYGARKNHPEDDATSKLSPYLHFGHISSHQVFDAVAAAEDWDPGRLAERATGSRRGWWGMSESAESFLDELVTWRELGFNLCSRRDDYDRYESLPAWAHETLEAHAGDPREHLYDLDTFERGATHDALWNAAQGQLRAEGRIHNYLRMLWGKKILEWSPTPRAALDVMIELNNRYALDGRDPNSYSGIFWVLGRYDRPWGPERPVFGKVRYMTSRNTRRKYAVDAYVARYAA